MQVDFSIVIPTLNSEKFLEKTLDSIRKQNQEINIECIFSDGGSTDRTIEIINNFEQKNISKIVLNDQIGLSKALNSGFQKAKGKYLTYLNSDDMLAFDALFKIKKNFESLPNYEWIIGLCENIGNKNFFNKAINIYKKNLFTRINFNLLCINNIISQPSVYWRKTFFKKVGNFSEKLNYNMDYDMWLRMINISKPLKIKENLSFFRRHNNSLSHNHSLKQFHEKFLTMRRYNRNIFLSFLHLFLSVFIVLIYKITNY